jgi:hypothetical protein
MAVYPANQTNPKKGLNYLWNFLGTNLKNFSSYLKPYIVPYKSYTALISQTGTDAPTAIVLENTLGTVPTFNYEGVGRYSISLNGNFLTVNTFQLIGNNNLGKFDILNIYDNGDDSVRIDAGGNGKLTNTPIEIRIYN